MKPYSFTAELYHSSVPEVVKKLRVGVPPIEVYKDNVFRQNDVQAILNGGWELFKTDISSFFQLFDAEVPIADRLSTYNQLLFKAIEATEVVRVWKKA